ncbi:MAG: TetR/AcrR family transcriptional regulator [Acidimicrobiales bacterium]|nr:TetR/AcrR family transcriptional regulator [Acidimicrobiales bacterium]
MTDAADAEAVDDAPAPLTRDRLLELAGQVFADEGYAAVSVRDLARRSSLTTGAIYAHFLNKADLLVEAIDARVDAGVEAPRDIETTFRAYLEGVGRRYPERAQLRALLLEGAAAARGDAAVRERLNREQERRLESWIVEYEAAQGSGELDPDVDMRAAVMMLWAIELGLGVLEAFAIDAPDPEAWADLTRRFIESIEGPSGRSG